MRDIFLRYLPFELQRFEQPVKPIMAEPDRGASGRLSLGGIMKQRQENLTSSASHGEAPLAHP